MNINKHEEIDENINYPYVIFKIRDELFGLSSKWVKEIIQSQNFDKIPNEKPYRKGVINLRGEIINLIDLRSYLGYPEHYEDSQKLFNILEKSENDHKYWINELRNSVINNYPFKLPLSSHDCEFGKWYDNFNSDNYFFKTQIKKFEEPHVKIHETGLKVEELRIANKYEEAINEIDKIELNEFKLMMHQFKTTKENVNSLVRDVILIIEYYDIFIGLIVDEIISVDNISENQFQNAQDSKHLKNHEFISQFAKLDKYTSVISIFEPSNLEF